MVQFEKKLNQRGGDTRLSQKINSGGDSPPIRILRSTLQPLIEQLLSDRAVEQKLIGRMTGIQFDIYIICILEIFFQFSSLFQMNTLNKFLPKYQFSISRGIYTGLHLLL